MRILLLGDLILDEPDPGALLGPSRDLLRAADLVVGQVEVPHSLRWSVHSTDVPARPSDPSNLGALADVGLGVATLAGNHIADAGAEGIDDTIETLRGLGIATAGAGRDIAEARAPALVAAAGRRVGVLSYNCVGPRDGWARPSKAGCAYVEVLTHYELDHAGPGGPPRIFTFATPESLAALREDVAALREQADVVIVALHKGLGHVRASLAQYEHDVARAAVDAGADIVVGHHAHILRAVELYRGRPIFHGLGNFVTVTRALSPDNTETPEAAAWALRRVELFGFVPDPAMPTYPFHPESRNTMIADCTVGQDGTVEAAFVPCWIDDEARPVPLGPDGGDVVVDYVSAITQEAGIETSYRWVGDRVVCTA
ncbi:MAG TPA: CapA family protein [Gaiella sp.]|nr:CapA family protein [Gaiella sp.]HEX5582264.1 CapA family protein [Gaiella sp.]